MTLPAGACTRTFTWNGSPTVTVSGAIVTPARIGGALGAGCAPARIAPNGTSSSTARSHRIALTRAAPASRASGRT